MSKKPQDTRPKPVQLTFPAPWADAPAVVKKPEKPTQKKDVKVDEEDPQLSWEF